MRFRLLDEQEAEQGTKDCFASFSHVMNVLEEAKIDGQLLLGNPSVRA